jgi:AcrR family transcriptional regulator
MADPRDGGRPSRRQVAAAATRQEILTAARRLFADHGYLATTINQVAAAAGVAVQTVYSSVGSKAALVLALNDLIDAESGVADVATEVSTAGDPGAVLAGGVRLTRQLNERCGDIVRMLLAAEPSDADVAAAVRDGMRRHRDGAELVARRLGELDGLAAGVTDEQAATAVAVMTSPASWGQLTGDFGWTYDRAETWLVDSLSRLLLDREP